MHATFLELPAFHRRRPIYMDDDAFNALQLMLLLDPERGDLVRNAGGLRKMRFPDSRRGKGTRGGLRILYFWWEGGAQVWFFGVYDKHDTDELSMGERTAFKPPSRSNSNRGATHDGTNEKAPGDGALAYARREAQDF